MKIPAIRVLITLTMTAVCSATVQAQSSGSLSGGGLTGSSGLGSMGGQTTSSQGQTTGSGSSSASTTGRTTGTESSTGTSRANSSAAQQFIGGNATESFVGGARQAASQQAMTRQFQAFQNSQATANTPQSQQTGTPREIRTVLSIGFSFPSASLAQQSGRMADVNSVSLNRFTSTRPEFAEVSVTLTPEGVAVLNGSAASTESSRLAANLMRLQPGVRKVENRILVR